MPAPRFSLNDETIEDWEIPDIFKVEGLIWKIERTLDGWECTYWFDFPWCVEAKKCSQALASPFECMKFILTNALWGDLDENHA